MSEQTESLARRIDEFLQQLIRKPEVDRTKREELLIETGRAFCDQLSSYSAIQDADDGGRVIFPHDLEFTRVLKSYNAINRAYDIKDVDAELAGQFRGGRK